MPTSKSTHCLLLFAAWLVVCVPAGWGITQTARSAFYLFKSPTASPTSQPLPH